MKILSLHCDYIKFKPVKKAIREPEQISKDDEKGKEIKECLVILTSIQKADENNSGLIVSKLAENIKDISSQVNCKKIVLYPYAHLATDLASPQNAMKILSDAEAELKKGKFEVYHAPFGYYKEFELKCKGHPLSELSRQISVEETLGKTEIKEEYDPKQLLRSISKTKLDTTKLKDNDHRIIGQKLDLFSFHDVAPGMVFWHNNGLVIYNELISFLREEHRKAGYLEVSTPFVMDKKLWQISGHWEKYKENIFLTKYEGRDFAVKPMNCPGGILVFKSTPKSYNNLPLRMAELGVVHRQELSGVLAGLFRVIKFTQDDAHIFCTENQLEKEIAGIMEMIDLVYKKFGFDYHVELSTRPQKKIGEEILWDKAEKILEAVLKEKGIKFKVNTGDGAFYGPKIDFHIKDSLARTWQCATIQLDFAMPQRFDLEYVGEDNKTHRPVMLHRVVYGSLERFIGILLEHTNGNLPVWLAPIQVRVLSFTDRNKKKTEEVFELLKEKGIRSDIDLKDSTVNDKVRNAELEKIPYTILIGDKEEQNNTIALRCKGKKPEFGVKIEDFVLRIKEEISERK
ncbi:MAG: threonine--tRNA ligase [archaeon]